MFYSPFSMSRLFPASALDRIERAVSASEQTHDAELRVVVEPALEFADLLKRRSSRDRAVELFAQLGVWDTAQNNGVLLYILLAEHKIELIADRGIDARVGVVRWKEICDDIAAHFKTDAPLAGVLYGIEKVGAELVKHFPKSATDRDELPNRPITV